MLGAGKLEQEQSYERMLLADWIGQFNEALDRGLHPDDALFKNFDTEAEGCLSFNQFALMNEHIEVSFGKRALQRIFNMIDANSNKKIRLDELRNVANLTCAIDHD